VSKLMLIKWRLVTCQCVHVNTDTIGTGHKSGLIHAESTDTGHKTVSKLILTKWRLVTSQWPVSNFCTISLRLRCIRGNMLTDPKEEEEEEEVSNFILIEHRLVTSQCPS
jgi:hypothetical protein